MGAGKSSVMDAISFGLFGTFPALSHKRVKLDNLIKNRPSREKSAEVRISFQVGHDRYTVTRALTDSGSTTAKLEKNGSYLQAQPIRVNEEISSILKLDYDTFSRAVYSEQNGLDYFLNIAKSERKKQIDNMLGLDQFATAEENCTSLINSIKSMVSDSESLLGKMDTDSLRKSLEKASLERKKVNDEQEELQKREKKEKEKINEIKSLLEKQKGLYSKREAIAKEIVDIKSRIKTLGDEIEKIQKLGIRHNVASEYDEKVATEKELVKKLGELKKIERESTKQLADMQALHEQTKKRILDRNKKIEELKGRDEGSLGRKVEEETRLLNAIFGEESANKSKISDIQEWIKELGKHISKCPICERELDEESRKRLFESKSELVKKLEEETRRLHKSAEEKGELIKRLTNEYNSVLLLSKQLNEYSGLDEMEKEQNAKLLSKKKEHESNVESYEKCQKDHDSIIVIIQKLKLEMDSAKRKEEYESDVKKYSNMVEQKSKEHDSIEIDQKGIDALQESFARQSAVLSDISSNISSNTKYIINVDSQISDLVKQIDNIKSLEQRMEQRRAYVSNLNKFKSALVETEVFLRNRLVQSINNLLQSIWPEIYPYSDYSRLRLSAKPDDYSLEADVGLNGSDEWIQIDAVASGGERNIACLAMRISLAMVIVPNLRWLILDEPTHNVDSNGISKLISVLSDSLPKVVDQVFIITHDENLKQISEAKVYQFDRDKNSGGSTIANEL